MNSYNSYLEAAGPYPSGPQSSGYLHPNQCYPDIYHTRPNHATAPPNLVALWSRVASLEEQLAHARAEEDKANKAVQYFLRLQVNSTINDAGPISPNQDLSTLRYKLVRAKSENRSLRSTIRLILRLLTNKSGCLNGRGFPAGISPSENITTSPRPAESQTTGDLIELYSSGEPTAVDPSEHESASSVQAEAEGLSITEAYNNNHNKAEKLGSDGSVDRPQTQYVYRFGHRGGNDAPATDTTRDQIPGDYEEIDEEMAELALKFQDIAWTPQGKKLFLPETGGSLKEVGYEIALPSLNPSFANSEPITVPNQDDSFSSPTSEPCCAMKPGWSAPQNLFTQTELKCVTDLNWRLAGPQDLRFPDLFRYGIRFRPDLSERDAYRTIIISNLPLNVTMTKLLNRVRGGLIISAKLLDTAKLTGRMTALIIFQYEYAAMAFEEHAQEYPIKLNALTARVELVPTPTWPEPINLRKAINDHQHTRCLEVYNFPRHIGEKVLRRDLRIHNVLVWDAVEHVQMRTDGVLELRFSSIKYAGQAFGILGSFRDYKQCNAYFVADPCAQPFEVSVSNKGAAMVKDYGKTLKLEPEQRESVSSEDESTAIDQSGRLEKVEHITIGYEGTPPNLRGRGYHSLG